MKTMLAINKVENMEEKSTCINAKIYLGKLLPVTVSSAEMKQSEWYMKCGGCPLVRWTPYL